ncbi:LysR family transcriptional regulator [Advenella incenata]
MTATNTIYNRLLYRLKNRHLILLDGIQRHGTLTRTAFELGISQPAATRRLAELESLLEAQLFVRAGNRLEPTLLGKLALTRAQLLLQELAKWGQEIDAIQAGHGARLHIGVVQYIPADFLKDILKTMRERHNIVCTLTRATSGQLGMALLNHHIDCAIGRTVSELTNPAFVQELLYTERPALIAHPQLAHRLARSLPNWKNLAKMNWILPPSATPIGAAVSEVFIRAQTTPPVPVLETTSLDVIASMLSEDTDLLSIVPEFLAHEMASRGQIGIVNWQLDWSFPPISIIRRRQELSQAADELLVDVVRELSLRLAERNVN